MSIERKKQTVRNLLSQLLTAQERLLITRMREPGANRNEIEARQTADRDYLLGMIMIEVTGDDE